MKELNEFTVAWNSLNSGPNAVKRIDAEHPLNFYIGKNASGSKELLLISNQEPSGLAGSKAIEVQIGKREDGQWAIVFTLIKPEHEQLFITLCFDIVESSRKEAKNGINFVIKRFLKWQQLLAQAGDGLLSSEAEKGLFGEMLFFRSSIQKGISPAQIVDAWIGCDKADRDFVFDLNWFEIKTIDPSAVTVRISSIEQLDSPDNGELVVNFIEKTAQQDHNGLTLNELIADIKDMLKSDQAALAEFVTKLSIAGYLYNKKYDEHKYVCKYVKHYLVDRYFPRIVRQNLPHPIVKLSYELGISALSRWEIK